VPAVLALDVGSSSVRACVHDEGAAPLGETAQLEYGEAASRAGGAELDPDAILAATESAIEQAVATGPAYDAVGASCFWHSLLGVDSAGRPTTNVLTWRDTRSAPNARRLGAVLEREAVYARTGCPLHPSYWPAKLAWLAETDPDCFRASARFLSFSDYLYQRLYGETRTSISMASGTGLLDLHACTWDVELVEALGLRPDQLPELSDEPVGDAQAFPALGDGACSNVGAGCVTPDRAALMIGTSGALRVVCETDTARAHDGLFCYRLDAGRVVEGGSLSDGGNLHAWVERTLRLPEAAGLAERPPDGHGLTFLALLGGERSPGWNPTARGAVTGLSFETTALDLLQAALEGVAYRFAEIADLLPQVREVVATGHALLVDPDWTQIVADVLGRPITASGVEEGSLRGAAVAALERLGEQPGGAPLGRVFEPRPERTETYRLARERQRNLYRGVT
jgi:gluconokinase